MTEANATIEKLAQIPDSIDVILTQHKDDFAGVSEKLDEFNQAVGKLTEPSEEGPENPSEATLEAQAGVIGNLMKFNILGIPLGEAAIGGFSAMFVSEVIDGVAATRSHMTRGLIKLGGAAAINQWGGRLLGDRGKQVVILLLAFDAIRDITPLDDWARRASAAISGVLPKAGLAGAPDRQQNPARSRVEQEAESVAGNYYERLGR